MKTAIAVLLLVISSIGCASAESAQIALSERITDSVIQLKTDLKESRDMIDRHTERLNKLKVPVAADPIRVQNQTDEIIPAKPTSESLPAVGRFRFARALKDCNGFWTPQAGKEKENIEGFNKMSGEEFNTFTQKCLAALNAQLAQREVAPPVASLPAQRVAEAGGRSCDVSGDVWVPQLNGCMPPR